MTAVSSRQSETWEVFVKASPATATTKAAVNRLIQRFNRVLEDQCDAIRGAYYFPVRELGVVEDQAVSNLYYHHAMAHTLGTTRRYAAAVTNPHFKTFAEAMLALVAEAAPVADHLTKLKKAVAASKLPAIHDKWGMGSYSGNEWAMKMCAALRAAIEPQRAGYAVIIFERLRERVGILLKHLADAGGDAHKIVPEGWMSCADAAAANRFYHELCRWTMVISPRSPRSPRGPELRVPIPEAEIRSILQLRADTIAEADFRAYAIKLTNKILASFKTDAHVMVTQASVVGQLWTQSVLRVKVKDDAGNEIDQEWFTRMVLNRSVHDLTFNQWPTRRITRKTNEKT